MIVLLNPDQEQVIGQAIRAGLIDSAEDIVSVGVDAIRHRLEERPPAPLPDDENWSWRLREWMHRSRGTAPLLSDKAVSRDSIYGNRSA